MNRFILCSTILLVAAGCNDDGDDGSFFDHCLAACKSDASCDSASDASCEDDCTDEQATYTQYDCIAEGDDYYRCILEHPCDTTNVCSAAASDLSDCLGN